MGKVRNSHLPTLSQAVEKPRKKPVQARSAFTVEAILDATIQVLVAEGKDRLTTTKVALRAGVSVGTLYQYFPNKRSLLHATVRRKLGFIAGGMEEACLEYRGRSLCEIVRGVTNAFFRAKMREPEGSRALYAMSSDVGTSRISEEIRQRSSVALVEALESSPERLTVPAQQVVFVVQAAMTGASRQLLESRVPAEEYATVQQNLIVMLCAYVSTVIQNGC